MLCACGIRILAFGLIVAFCSSHVEAEESRWVYFGHYSNKKNSWAAKYFRSDATGRTEPRTGDFIVAKGTSYKRESPIEWIKDVGWQTSRDFGATKAGEKYEALDVKIVASGYYWVKIPDKPFDTSRPIFAATSVHIGTKNGPENVLQWFAGLRTSDEGQFITKRVADYYGIPEKVVDWATENWKTHVAYKTEGDETRGIFGAPPDYAMCWAEPIGEVSIRDESTLNVTLRRNATENGLSFYMVVPYPRWLDGSQWADAKYLVTFLRRDMLRKLECEADGKAILRCDHGNC